MRRTVLPPNPPSIKQADQDGEEEPPGRGDWTQVSRVAIVALLVMGTIVVTGHAESGALIGSAFMPMLR